MDKFAELIDDIALAQGFEEHINARRAISSAIEELKQERDNLKTVLHGNQDADYDKQLQIETLKEQLKSANEDAERLANKLQEYADADDVVQLSNSGTITEPYKFISDVIELHRARLAGKEGE